MSKVGTGESVDGSRDGRRSVGPYTRRKMRKAALLLATVATAVLVSGGAALAAGELDQQQTNTASGVGLDRNFQQGQTFTVGAPGALDKVQVPVWLAISSNVGDLQASIQTLDGSGLPSGTTLASGSVPVGNFTVGSGSASWVDISLTQPVPVFPGEEYALVLSTANAPSDGSFYNWKAALNDPYPGGTAVSRNQTGQWFLRHDNGVGMDFAFKTFVDAAPSVQQTGPAARRVSPRAKVTATFSEPMLEETVETGDAFTLKRAGGPVPARVSYDADTNKATLIPDKPLKRGATYVAIVGPQAEDSAGVALDQDPATAGNQPKTWKIKVRR
jgi:hypothetical protein